MKPVLARSLALAGRVDEARALLWPAARRRVPYQAATVRSPWARRLARSSSWPPPPTSATPGS